MKKTIAISLAATLSCAALLTGCSADNADNASGTNSTDSTGKVNTVLLSEKQMSYAIQALKTGYRGEEAANIAAMLYKPGAYESYMAYAKNEGRWDDIEKADRVKVGVLNSIYYMSHPNIGVSVLDQNLEHAVTGGTFGLYVPIPYAPDIKDAIIQEYEKFYTDYRARVKECKYILEDRMASTTEPVPVQETQEQTECMKQEKKKKNEYIIKLIREVPIELTPLAIKRPSEERQKDLDSNTSDEELLKHISEKVPNIDWAFDEQLGYR